MARGLKDLSLVQHTRRSGPAYRSSDRRKQEHMAWEDYAAKAHSAIKEDIGATDTLRQRRK
jgi:hypothetical protein